MKKNPLVILILISILVLNSITSYGSTLLTPVEITKTFIDIPSNHWAATAIEQLASQGIINGVNSNEFKPNQLITRGEFTKLIVALLDLNQELVVDNPFKDINTKDWYSSYVLTAYNYQLVNGTSKTNFSPKSNITREEVFTVLYRMLDTYCLDQNDKPIQSPTDYTAIDFSDSSQISTYSKDPINTLLSYKIINGYTNHTIRPKDSMSRAEAAFVIHKIATNFSGNLLTLENPVLKSSTPLTPPQSETIDIRPQEIGQYTLTESTSQLTLWTDYPSERIFKDTELPSTIDSGVHVYLAKNEFEPFQLIINPSSTISTKISIVNQPTGLDIDLYKVMYVDLEKSTDNLGQTGFYPDPLYPMDLSDTIQLTKNENQPLWFSLYAQPTMEAGDYTFLVDIEDLSIPIHVHIFDFEIPKELHVKSQINVSTQNILEKYNVTGTKENYWKYVDSFKQFFIDHRLTPKSALWSGGLTSSGGSPYIDYNSSTGEFNDPHGIWGFEYPANRYLEGSINTENSYLPSTPFNNGVGFPSFMAMTFRNNDASKDQRPDVFEDITLQASDWYLSDNINSPYNKKWFKYMNDIESYLKSSGYLDKAYYYFANEPQNQEDYDAVAWYARELKKAAPDLNLMVSEEPKPEIYDNSTYPGAKIDQWLPVLNNYNPVISWDREKNHDEETWIYFLHGTKPPYFNPITLDHPGIESKLTGWFLWKYRIKGIAHYSFNNWSSNVWEDTMTSGHNGDNFMLYPPGLDNNPITYGDTNHKFVSSIRFELMRDSLEDYEYLYLLNQQQQPQVLTINKADSEVDKIIYGLTSYNRDSQFMYSLRKYIGLKIMGQIDTIPFLEASNTHERANATSMSYYINFQNPDSSPSDNPLIIDGNEYIKIGWNNYDEALGYGWYGDMDHVMYRNLDHVANPLQGSILYDDWGREKTFEFDLPNGTYNVTISCGWEDRSYDHNKITIEGVSFINDEKAAPYIIRTQKIEIKDNKLTMEMGIFDEYTMLNYLEIEKAD